MAQEIILSKETMSSVEVSELTSREHKNVMRDIRDLLDQGVSQLNFELTSYRDKQGKERPCYSLTKKGCLILASGYNAVLREKIINRWEELETGKAQPIAKQPKKPSVTPTRVRASLEWVKGVSEFLNLNDSSKLTLLGKVAQPLELPLPDYTPSKGIIKSASELLQERGLVISVREFNSRAIECGYLKILERNSSHGQKKKFKSITEKGTPYGENQVHPNNPKSTQPYWYADKFDELLGLIGIQISGGMQHAS
jgi:Rha family phage regulatory protein